MQLGAAVCGGLLGHTATACAATAATAGIALLLCLQQSWRRMLSGEKLRVLQQQGGTITATARVEWLMEALLRLY